MKRLLADREFRLLLSGQTLTMFGDVALFLVLGIWIKDLTGSNGAAGAAFFALSVPALIAPLAGVYIDRFSRRKVMILNDLVTGAVILALFAVHDRGDVWIIFLVASLYGASQQVFFAARSGLLVSMLRSEDLAEANSLLESIRQGLRVAGPLLGAAIYAAWGGRFVAAIDSVTFIVSAALLATMRVTESHLGSATTSFRDEVGAGVRHIRRTPVLRVVVAVICVALGAIGLLQVALFALVEEGLHKPPSFIGVLAMVQGIGSVVGGVAAGRGLKRVGEARLLGVTLCLMGAGLALLVTTAFPVVMVGVFVVGIGLSGHLVAYMTLIQRRTTDELQGRVFSAAEALLTVPFAVSMAAGVVIIDAIDYRLIYAVNGIVLGLTGLWLARWQDPDEREERGEAEPHPSAGPVEQVLDRF